MDWIERLNAAINYIEEHITEELDLSKVAKVAGCSTYHFQRMFNYMANVPLSEYVRRRRMSLAVADLQSDEAKIIDVALKYGYGSPTSFNCAFQSVHGIAPSLVKQNGTSIKSYPPISFKIIVKGVEEMNYRIEKREAFRIVGTSKILDKEFEKNVEVVLSQMWHEAAMSGTIPKLLSMMDSQPMGLLGVSVCNDSEEWRYCIAVSTTKEADEELQEYNIPSYTWAIFYGEGPLNPTLPDLQKRIVTEWLPTSGYEYDIGPDIELYLNDDPQNAKFEIWLPIRKPQ